MAIDMNDSVCTPKAEYDDLIMKATLFDHYVETEELTSEELSGLKEALKGNFITKAEFLKRHPELK